MPGILPRGEREGRDETNAAIRAGDFHLVREISEPDGTVSFMVLER